MGEHWKDPPPQRLPEGFVLVTLKPEGMRLRYRQALIAGYYWNEYLNATLLYVKGVPKPFKIWEMPEDLDALLAGCSPDQAVLRPTAVPVNGIRRRMGRLHARHHRAESA
jgi:hypothetical protein